MIFVKIGVFVGSGLAVLLAPWPFNVWILIGLGVAWYYTLCREDALWSFSSTNTRDSSIRTAEAIEKPLVSSDHPNPVEQYLRIVGDKHLRDTPGDTGINPPPASQERSRHGGDGH